MTMKNWLPLNVLILTLFLLMAPGNTQANDIRHVRITYGAAKTSLPLTVVLPREYDGKLKLRVLLALPPGSGDADMVEGNIRQFWMAEADARGYIIVAPEILGSSLSNKAGDVLNAIFGWMDANIVYDPNRVMLTGQSNGGMGAFHAALAQPDRFSKIIVLPGAYLGPSEDFAKLKGKPVWLLVGGLDGQWKAMSELTRDGLREAQAMPELTIIPGQGHVFWIDPRRLYDWMSSP